jgi:hypothetical protein
MAVSKYDAVYNRRQKSYHYREHLKSHIIHNFHMDIRREAITATNSGKPFHITVCVKFSKLPVFRKTGFPAPTPSYKHNLTL